MGGVQSCSQPPINMQQNGCCHLDPCQGNQNPQCVKPLSPILFSQRESDRNSFIRNTEMASEPQISKQIENKPQQLIVEIRRSQKLFEEESGTKELVILNTRSNNFQTLQNTQYQPICVPFSVIKLAMDSTIINQITTHYSSFFKQHENAFQNERNRWRLEPQGFYSNLIEEGRYTLISSSWFFQGNCLFRNHQIQLSGKSIFIKKEGMYEGYFENSMAHGQGSYLLFRDRKKYEGIWENGTLKKGLIDSKFFSYNGELSEGKPSGFGKLIIKKSGIHYEGSFLNGYFDDQNAQYYCPQYSYKGGFKEGKKTGYGILQQKLSERQKASHIKTKLLRLRGIWEGDRLIKPELIE